MKLQSLLNDSDIVYSRQVQQYLLTLHSSLQAEGNKNVIASIVYTLTVLIREWYENVLPPVRDDDTPDTYIHYNGYHAS